MGAPLCFFLALAQVVLGAPVSKVPEDAVAYVPIADPNVDRNSFANLAPTWKPLLAAQEPSGRNLSIELHTAYPTIILENSAHITSHECKFNDLTKTSSIIVQFDSAQALTFALGWPRQELVLLTNHHGCNPGNERGVYLTRKAHFDRRGLKATFFVRPKDLKDVSTTTTIHVTGESAVLSENGEVEVTQTSRPNEAELK